MDQHASTGMLLREVARLHINLQRLNVACCRGTTVTQCSVLTELGRSGPVPLAELSRRLDLDKGWISRAVEQLAQEGLVEKVPSETDHRMVRISLSPVGEQRLAELSNILNGLVAQVMEHIPVSEQAGVQHALFLLQGALQAELEQSSAPAGTETKKVGQDACSSSQKGAHMPVRVAIPSDATALAAIYNQGIEDRVATFETRLRSPQDMLESLDQRYPVVVLEQNQEVLAFASTSSYRARECYAGIAEFSVYVRREWRGRGLGRIVLTALVHEAEKAGFWKLVSRVFVENSASRSLLCKLGFREVGIYEKHAQLDGVWRDVVIVERLIPTNLHTLE